MTSEIYKQQQAGKLMGAPRPEGLEIPDFDGRIDWDQDGLTDPDVPNQFFNKGVALNNYPIWAEDDPAPPVDPTDPDKDYLLNSQFVEYLRTQSEFYDNMRKQFEAGEDDPRTNGSTSPTFGL